MEKNYDYYSGVLSTPNPPGSLKKNALAEYREQIDYVFINGGRKLGQYRLCAKNNKKGILDEYDIWSFLNTINTHRRAFMYICELYKKFTKLELDFSTRESRIESFKSIKKFLEDNYELLFTRNIKDEYYNQFELFCNKSWMGGIIDTITFLYFVERLFPDVKIKEIIWNTERGDPDDFIGIDVRVVFVTGFQKTIQLKRCSSSILTDGIYTIDGAYNGFDKEVDYYGYIKINPNEHYSEVFLFPHSKSYMVDGNKVEVPENKVKTFKETNMVSETLLNMLTFCADNRIIFNITKEGEKNDVTFINDPRKEVNVVMPDINDNNLENLLTEKFIELEKFFK